MICPPGQPADPDPGSAGHLACVRHPDRPTGLRCTRCDQPACPDCLREAAVGYQCVDCVRSTRRTTRGASTVAGAPVDTTPLITPLLIAVNVVIYLITALQAHSFTYNTNSPLGTSWYLWPPLVAAGQWWRIVTSGFIHFGLIHIALNMVSLWIVGRDLERVLGRLRFSVVYGLALFGGGVGAYLFGSIDAPEAGASGAVFGLMGALLVLVVRLKLSPGQVIALVAGNLILSFSIANISWQAHIGGLVIGAVIAIGMVYPPASRRNIVQIGTVAVVIAVLVGLFLLRNAELGSLVCPTNFRCYRG